MRAVMLGQAASDAVIVSLHRSRGVGFERPAAADVDQCVHWGLGGGVFDDEAPHVHLERSGLPRLWLTRRAGGSGRKCSLFVEHLVLRLGAR
jgi:hypothetical protein